MGTKTLDDTTTTSNTRKAVNALRSGVLTVEDMRTWLRDWEMAEWVRRNTGERRTGCNLE